MKDQESEELERLPHVGQRPVGSVLVALEAKACMTAHQRALPRLYDELNSSHATVHASSDQAIAAGLVMVNIAARYLSPDRNKSGLRDRWSSHKQPKDAILAIDKVRQIPRRAAIGAKGYDALSIIVVDCANDGSPVRLVEGPPAPAEGDIYRYERMIDRMAAHYATRFRDL